MMDSHHVVRQRRRLFIVTHWAKVPAPDWEWRVFVLATDEAEAVRLAVGKKPWQIDGQIHLTMVSEDEFIQGAA